VSRSGKQGESGGQSKTKAVSPMQVRNKTVAKVGKSYRLSMGPGELPKMGDRETDVQTQRKADKERRKEEKQKEKAERKEREREKDREKELTRKKRSVTESSASPRGFMSRLSGVPG
jgi:hypothetical protein